MSANNTKSSLHMSKYISTTIVLFFFLSQSSSRRKKQMLIMMLVKYGNGVEKKYEL